MTTSACWCGSRTCRPTCWWTWRTSSSTTCWTSTRRRGRARRWATRGASGGSTTEVNILTALGANGDASLGWLASDGPRAATNLERLLRYNPSTDDPTLGAALAPVVDNGLQHPDGPRSDALFEIAVDTIGEQDMVNFGDQMLPVLGEGARTHMDQLAARTNEVISGTPGRPDQHATRALYDAHDFLKEVMAKPASRPARASSTAWAW